MAKEQGIGELTIHCKGRDHLGKEVLNVPVEAKVTAYHPGGDSKYTYRHVKCIYNTGGHGQRCKASHPEVDKLGEGVLCPFAVDKPFTKVELLLDRD